MSNQGQGVPYMTNQMYQNNFGMQGVNYNNPNMNNVEPPKKERLIVKLTSEERGFYSNLFQIADKDGKGKLIGKEAADFLKKSGLTKEILKTIWLISAQTDPQHLERDEFYLALRLIALAQNKMDYSEESIRLNHPQPPMPKFDLKSNLSTSIVSNSNESVFSSKSTITISEIDHFSLTEEDAKKYLILFNKNKDIENKISFNKAYQMWTIAGVSNEIMNKILIIVPLQEKNCLNFIEFKVIFHLIYKSIENDIPGELPNSLKKVLDPENSYTTGNSTNNKNLNSEINFGDKFGVNLNLGHNNKNISNINNSNINSSFSPLYNKKTDFENITANLSINSNEFNLKHSNVVSEVNSNFNSTSIIPINNYSNINPNFDNNLNTTMQSTNLINSNQNNFQQPKQNLQNFSNNILDKFTIIKNDSEQENKFLNKVFEEDNSSLGNILEDIERITRSLNLINDKNRIIKDQITDTRRKINMERDNLAKLTFNLNQKTNELISNQEELLKTMDNYNNLKIETHVTNNRNIMPTVNNNFTNISNVPINNFKNDIVPCHIGNINEKEFQNNNSNNKNNNVQPSQFAKVENSANNNFTNFAVNSGFNKSYDTEMPTLNSLNNYNNLNNVNNSLITPINEKIAKLENLPNNNIKEFKLNNEGSFPHFNSNNKFDFDNATFPVPSENNFAFPQQNNNIFNTAFDTEGKDINKNGNFQFPLNNNQPEISNYNVNQKVHNEFAFDEFNEFPQDSFKEFAEKKGDDFFKNNTDFKVNWDDF